MKKKFKSIRSHLFLSYSVFLLILVLLIVTPFYAYIHNLLKNRAMESLSTLGTSVSSWLDNEIRTMDETTLQVAYSETVRIKLNPNRPASQDETLMANYSIQKALMDIFNVSLGYFRTVHQISLYDFDGMVSQAGFVNGIVEKDVRELHWYDQTQQLDGRKFISSPWQDGDINNNKVISLCRIYFSVFREPLGIIEVQQRFSHIEETIRQIARDFNRDTTDILVFNDRNQIIYPLIDSDDERNELFRNHMRTVSQLPGKANEQTLSVDVGNELVVCRTSDYSGWTVVVAESKEDLFASLRSLSTVISLLTFLSMILTLMISFYMSKRLTLPISQMHEMVQGLNIDAIPSSSDNRLGSGLNEMEELYNSFQNMNVRLKTSIDQTLEARTQEMNSRMLALQAQMNPHFLYNTITVISVMAEENANDEIIHACKELSGMLRYVSSSKTTTVEIEKEINHTRSFLQLMKYRYEEDVNYLIDVDDRLNPLMVPRLIVQPLVENSFKYGLNVQPPWSIKIKGRIEKGKWIISVQDNGGGFSDDALKGLNGNIRDFDLLKKRPRLHIAGMGLINIYARLSYLYGEEKVFAVSNRKEGGAEVKIGGPVSQAPENVKGEG